MPNSVRVVIVRGRLVTPWELRPWALLPERFQVGYLYTRSNMFEPGHLGLERIPARGLRDLLPRGRVGDLVAGVAGERYLGLEASLAGADVVHAAELSFWFAAEAARHKRRLGYALVQTVWETIPLLESYRNREARANRRRVLAETDLFVAATERARQALLLEGIGDERIVVSPPGVDVERFRAGAAAVRRPSEHVIVSPGRLVWEKGHQDVLRAVAALHRGLVDSPADRPPRLLIVGRGPEEARLRAYAQELGLAEFVDLRAVPYDEMPSLFAASSCVVLASLASAGCELPPLSGRFRCFWEEQFGMVLAEAMAAGLPLVVSSSGAIPEVVDGTADLFLPGDWMGLARALAEGPLSRPVAERVEYPAELVSRYSTAAAADRLAAVYDRVLDRRAAVADR
jgi:glycosyltransferase involved in cell wall biosynthesis